MKRARADLQVGARALLAYRYCERTTSGGPTDDAYLGALMESEYQAAVVHAVTSLPKKK